MVLRRFFFCFCVYIFAWLNLDLCQNTHPRRGSDSCGVLGYCNSHDKYILLVLLVSFITVADLETGGGGRERNMKSVHPPFNCNFLCDLFYRTEEQPPIPLITSQRRYCITLVALMGVLKRGCLVVQTADLSLFKKIGFGRGLTKAGTITPIACRHTLIRDYPYLISAS